MKIFTHSFFKPDQIRVLASSLLICLFLVASLTGQAQTSRNASTEAEFAGALSSSATNDIINITDNIVVTSEITLDKSITITGNGFTVTVPNPGLDDMGRFNTVTSGFRVFTISNSVTVTINNLTIKGGMISSGNGGAIYVSNGCTLHLSDCIICNSRNGYGSQGGGGIANYGVTYLTNSLVTRNAAEYGGGFINSGTMFVENSTFSENRSTRANGGGGAGENQGTIFINNSTISNNQSTEIGGGINNYRGTVYLLNSSVTGNVAYGSNSGGGVGNNDGYVYAFNTLFAHNYRRSSGTVSSPTAYQLDDIVAFLGQNNVFLYYCIYHAGMPVNTNNVIGNIQYSGSADGSNNTIFSGGALSKITDGTGTEIGTANVYRPFLYNNDGLVAPTLKSGSFTLQTDNKGTQTRFADNNNVNPVVAYYDRTANSWVDYMGTSASGQLVSNDQVSFTRTDPPAIGAIQGITDNLYMVKINAATNGSVNGGTIYGDVYSSGTSVSITAIPYTGYNLVRWDYVLGGSGTASTTNPYTFTVNTDITLVPVFAANSGGSYDITYVGNDNTGGDAPPTGTFSAPTTILGAGNLVKAGYSFGGWNTNANGSGTNYVEGVTYSSGANLNLYANWQLVDVTWTGTTNTDWNTATNWSPNTVPTAVLNATIPDVTNDPIVNQDAATPAACNNLSIASGAVLTIAAGKALVVSGTLTNSSGTAGLVIKSTALGTGSLLHNTANVNATVERYISGTTNLLAKKYHLVSVPFNSTTFQSEVWLDSYLFTYVESTNAWRAWGDPPNNILQTSQGAMVYYPGVSKTYSISGQLNNGAYTPEISYSGANNGYNLVPNPYPSAIDWILVTKTNVTNSIWIFDPDPTVINYEGYINGVSNGAGHVTNIIPAGQGFFVKATDAGLTFTNAVRVNNAKNFTKSATEIDNVLHLIIKSSSTSDGIAVRFATDATTGHDNDYDLEKFYGSLNSPQLCAVSDNEELSIIGLPLSMDNAVVQLKLIMDYTGELTFNASGMESFSIGTAIILEDKQLAQLTNLETNPIYTFNHTPQDAPNRFVLHFGSVLGVDNPQTRLLSNIVVSGHDIYINCPAATNSGSRVALYDIQGRVLWQEYLSNTGQDHFSLKSSGVYLVKILLPTGIETHKIVVP